MAVREISDNFNTILFGLILQLKGSGKRIVILIIASQNNYEVLRYGFP